MILTPSQSLFDSTETDVAARFGDQSLGDLGGLMHDYETENAALRAAIERDGLDDYFAEVVRLAEEGAAGDESTAMVE